MCVHTDLALKLSGMRSIAYEKVDKGWNVAIEFLEKRPKKANPVYQGELGQIVALAGRMSEGTRLDNVREIVFFPELKQPTEGFSEYQTVDRGSYTVKGFSKFFKQADYNEMFNSSRQAKLDGGFIYKMKKNDSDNDNDMMVIQKENASKNVRKIEQSAIHPEFFKGTKDENFKLKADIENGPSPEKIDLETIYPMRYILKKGQWVPQVVHNLDTYHKPNSGIPSRTEPKKLGVIVPVVSGEGAGVSGAWSPANAVNRGKKSGFTYMPEYLKSTQEKVEEAQLGMIQEEKQAFEASKGVSVKMDSPFNPPRIVKK